MPAQDDLNDALWDALQKKDWFAAEDHFRAGADLEHANIRGETPFRFFAAENQMEAAVWLVERGANVDASDYRGDTALIRSVERKNFDQFNAIMEMSPDLDARNVNAVTALMQACNQKVDEMVPFVERLLLEGANPSLQSFLGGSPLLNSVARGDKKIVTMLLDAGANINVTDPDGLGVLHIAMRTSDEDASMALLLLSRAGSVLDINLKAKSGATPMSFACDVGKFPAVKALMDLGADVNVRSNLNNDRTPLMVMFVMDEGHGLVEQAIQMGADVNARDLEGNNVLFYASQKVNPSLIELLVSAGCDIENVTGPSGFTPLHGAINIQKDAPRQAAMEALLNLGFPVDPPFGEGGKTDGNDIKPFPSPLSWAVMKRDATSVEMLIDMGAEPNRVDTEGLTAMHRLADVGVSSIEQYALQKISQTKGITQEKLNQEAQNLSAMVLKDTIAIMDALGSAGADFNAKGPEGRTPIMDYVSANRLELVTHAFLNHKADPLQADEFGDHALTVALKKGHSLLFNELAFEMREAGRDDGMKTVLLDAIYASPESWEERRAFLKTLKQCGQRAEWLNASDEEGNHPLLVAAATSQPDVVEALIAMGADVDKINNKGETALMHAAMSGNTDTIYALRRAGADTSIRTPERKTAETFAQHAHLAHSQRALVAAVPEYEDLNPEPVAALPPAGRLFRPQATTTIVPAMADLIPPPPALDDDDRTAPAARPASTRPRMR